MASKKTTPRDEHTTTQGDEQRKGLLEDLSMSQIVAGALAAVTSVALSSQSGVTALPRHAHTLGR